MNSVEVTSGGSSVVSRDALLTVLAGAQVCTAFNSGQPAGSKVFGDAKVDSSGGVAQSGVLKLTTSANNQSGSFLFPSPNGAIPVVLTQTPPPGTQLEAGVYGVSVSAMERPATLGSVGSQSTSLIRRRPFLLVRRTWW